VPKSDKPALELDWRERNWEIDVSSVPLARKHTIESLLHSDALPAIAAWLSEHADTRMGRQSIAFIFNEETEKLSIVKSSGLFPPYRLRAIRR
jgi:hypothetical protein